MHTSVPEEVVNVGAIVSASLVVTMAIIVGTITITVVIGLVIFYRTKITLKHPNEQQVEPHNDEPDGFALNVDEKLLTQGCERFVPTMVKKYESMVAEAEAE